MWLHRQTCGSWNYYASERFSQTTCSPCSSTTQRSWCLFETEQRDVFPQSDMKWKVLPVGRGASYSWRPAPDLWPPYWEREIQECSSRVSSSVTLRCICLFKCPVISRWLSFHKQVQRHAADSSFCLWSKLFQDDKWHNEYKCLAVIIFPVGTSSTLLSNLLLIMRKAVNKHGSKECKINWCAEHVVPWWPTTPVSCWGLYLYRCIRSPLRRPGLPSIPTVT